MIIKKKEKDISHLALDANYKFISEQSRMTEMSDESALDCWFATTFISLQRAVKRAEGLLDIVPKIRGSKIHCEQKEVGIAN